MNRANASIPKNDFDTLVVSDDSDLFEHIAKHVSQNDPTRKVRLIYEISELQPIELWLGKCTIMICDIRSSLSLLETGALLVENAPLPMLAIGLYNDAPPNNGFFSLPASQRLSAVISMKDGVQSMWQQIINMKQQWDNPLMISKIEEVPVSDILQMISTGRWNSTVQISGHVSLCRENEKKSINRIRGSISFWNGTPHSAWSSFHTGIDAVCDLLSVRHGVLQIIRPIKAPLFRNIQGEMQDILLSYMVSLDEASNHPLEETCEIENLIESIITPHSQREATPPISEKPAAGKKNTQALDEKPSPLTNSFWSQDIDLTSITNALANAEARSLPLRWMTVDELQRLSLHDTQSAFLVFRGDHDFIVQMLGICARGFHTEKMDNSQIPVLRLGRFQGINLYMICLEITVPCSPADSSPCAVYCADESKQNENTFREISKHPAVVLLLPAGDKEIPADRLPTVARASIRAHIPAPLMRWECISETVIKILSLVTHSSAGGAA